MFIGSTRRSALNPRLPAYLPHFALPLPEAVVHGTADAAWACHAEEVVGRIRPGLLADLVVLDRHPFTAAPETLLHTRVLRTLSAVRTVWEPA